VNPGEDASFDLLLAFLADIGVAATGEPKAELATKALRDTLAERGIHSSPDFVATLATIVGRVESGLRPAELEPITVGHLHFDVERHEVRNGHRRLPLTPNEWRLLVFFTRNPGRVLSRSVIAEGVWGASAAHRTGHVELYVSRLRRKIESPLPHHPRLIETVHRRGYVFHGM